MSQAYPPSAMGRCTVCKQAQPYTSQICDICQSRLPWAVQAQPSMPVPPPLPNRMPPTRPVAPPTRSGNSWSPTVIVIVSLVGGLMVFGAIGVYIVWRLGYREPVTIANGQAPTSIQSRPAGSAGCGTFTTDECQWNRGFQAATNVIDLHLLKDEQDLEYFDRMSRQAFQARATLYGLPPVPPLFQEVDVLAKRALSNWDTVNQTAKRAVETRSRPLIREALDGFDQVVDEFDEVDRKLRVIRATHSVST